jgi:hypothetical protein
VAIVWEVLEEIDSRRRCKLCGMVKLQAGVSELGRFLGSNRLPHLWGWAPCLACFVRNQFHKYPVKTTPPGYVTSRAATSEQIGDGSSFGVPEYVLAKHIQS